MGMSPRLLRPKTFSPASIPGLSLWLDPSRLDSVTLNGTTVSEIRDLSGNERHFSQPDAVYQPTYYSFVMPSGRALNSLFFGGSSYMEGNTAALNQFTGDHLYAFSLSSVVRMPGGTAGVNGVIYATSIGLASNQNRISFQSRSTTGVVSLVSRILDADAVTQVTVPQATYQSPLFATFSFFGTSQWIPEQSLRQIYVRSYTADSGTTFNVGSGGNGTTTQTPSLATRLGANLQTGRFYGNICEFATYRRKLELQEVNALASYYKSKWETL